MRRTKNLRGYIKNGGLNLAGVLKIKSAVASAEIQLGHKHPVMDACRSKACHTLRRYGYWNEADDLWARGQVFGLIDFESYSDLS